MALSVFDDRKASPTDAAIGQALGRSAAAWSRLKAKLTGESALEEEWAFAGAKFGWSLRLKRGKRVIVYMTPCAGHFLASFVLGEKACAAASEAGLPAAILAAHPRPLDTRREEDSESRSEPSGRSRVC